MAWLRKVKALDPSRAADIIERFANGELLLFEWQNFVGNARHADPRVAEARERCAAVPQAFPPDVPGAWCSRDGRDALRAIARDLRSGH